MSQINKSRINFKPNKINYMQLEVFELFPTPVLKFNIGRNFTKEEIEFVVEKEKEVTQPPFALFIGNNTTVNKKILEHPSMIHLKSIAEGCLQEWCKEVYNPLHGDKFKLKITQSWLNYTKPGEYHHTHEHPNSFVSGVLYIHADTKEDKIKFHKAGYQQITIETAEFDILNSKSWWFGVETGKIVLFPSCLTHNVEQVTAGTVRISLAFNTFLKGTIGDNKTLTELINA